MRSESQWRDGEEGARRRQLRRRVLWIACLSLCGFVGRAGASELIIGREALQTLVVASVFKDQGRWYLVKGKCYAYLERPHVALDAARVIIDAHLSSRLGLTVGDSCVGTELMSDVKVSGTLVGSGTHIEIDDIRIDNVQDESTRKIIDLLQSATGKLLAEIGEHRSLAVAQANERAGNGYQSVGDESGDRQGNDAGRCG